MATLTEADRVRGGDQLKRREFLWKAFGLGGFASSSLAERLIPTRLLATAEARSHASDARASGLVTANADFFVRDHFAEPRISNESWSLVVVGLVSKPLKLSYPDILLIPSVRQAVTLECAGNLPGGAAVGTSGWSGVPLATLLKQAGVRQGASTIVLHGADSGEAEGIPPGTHFVRAIPLEKAMEPSTLLAYAMNGDPLATAHGFPIRALVSGWYGMDSVKWLTRIEVLDQPFAGYFQQSEYVAMRGAGERHAITRMAVNSKIVRPSEDEQIHSDIYRVEGFAWAGERKVAKVQIRANGIGEWHLAKLDALPLARVWTPWSYNWHIQRSGQCTLEVRATDEDGNAQPGVRDPERKDLYQLNTPQRVRVNVRFYPVSRVRAR